MTAATVSIITLEATMLTSFGVDMDPIIKKLFLGITGAVISVFVVSLALMTIVKGIISYKGMT